MYTDIVKDLILRRLLTVQNNRIVLFRKLQYTMYPARAMARTLQHIGNENGEEYLFKLGYEAGADAAEEMIENMHLIQKAFPGKLTAIQLLLEIIGFGKPLVKVYDIKHQKLITQVVNHPVIENGKNLFGEKSMACSFYRGVYSAHVQRELGIKNAHFEEYKCICKGTGDHCLWVTGLTKKETAEAMKKY
ncbi:hypothetical protein HY638_04435 [Candidatus Woesearchaeota archaeon]|nr:hypothetical protein [Candidatus Woesearchaeota archaeon]